MGALSDSAGTPQVLRMLRPASKTKTASAPAHSSRQAETESPRVGPLPEQRVSLEGGVTRASPARSRSLSIASAQSPKPVPRAPPGPPRSRPASGACRFQRTQELPRRPEWTPKSPARDPRRTLIPTRVPPRGLDTRRLQEPPPPPPLPPPPLARRGGEGIWRGRPRSAPDPPPLRPGTQPLSARNATPRLQPQGPAHPSTPARGSLLTPSAGSRRAPGTRDPALNGSREPSVREAGPSCAHVCAHPLHFYFSNLGVRRNDAPKSNALLSSANEPFKDPMFRVLEEPKAGSRRARARRVFRT